MTTTPETRVVRVDELRIISNILAERLQGNPARSPAHNARLLIDGIIAAPAAPAPHHVDEAAVDAAIAAAVDHQREDDPEAARWPCDYDGDEVSHARDRMGRAIAAYLAAAPVAPADVELSGNTGELRELIAQTIRDDGSYFGDCAWGALSDERKRWWLGDADRVLAAIKDYLTTAAPPAPVAASAVDGLRDALLVERQWHATKDEFLVAGGAAASNGARHDHLQRIAAIDAALAATPSSPNPVADNPAGDPVVNAPRVREAPEDEAEHFIQAAIDSAPEPLRRLGEWLANKLDDDDWKTADRLITGAAVALKDHAAPAPEPARTITCNKCGIRLHEDDLVRATCTEDGEACDACPKCGTDHYLMDAPPAPLAAPAPEPVAWRPIHSAPEDTHVILATSGGVVGEALMLRDEDTGQKKWTWALGPVHANHVPLGWMPMPSSIDQPVGG